MDEVKLFSPSREALFARRPNRFLIIAKDGKTEIKCHCPNPGRLIEFVFPGAKLILEKRDEKNEKAKTPYTAVGIYYRDTVAPLFSARANKAAEQIILREIIPNIKEIHPEFTLGDSRFDFLCIDKKGMRHLVEVKACSLVEYGAAMFPDAPSGRALKHLEELAGLSAEGYSCHVLFVIVHSKPERFIPNLHTDPEFAAALSKYGRAADPCDTKTAAENGPVVIHACLLECSNTGMAHLAAAHVPVDLSHGELAASDAGNYLIQLEIPETYEIETGGLGTIRFKAGWYVYAGSARKNLAKRINRHLRKIRKQKHWHIDYLTPFAKTIKGLPIMSYRNLECDLAAELKTLGGKAIPGFGSSDCHCKGHKCPGHLYYFKDRPMGNREFVEMLLRYRHVEGLERGTTHPSCRSNHLNDPSVVLPAEVF
ncbi:hypothetical protein FACS189491_00420 [Spirochaetia bacterium]|nr:hypothetical protein FACS189491_00420 [Spirochaetia bacterium]